MEEPGLVVGSPGKVASANVGVVNGVDGGVVAVGGGVGGPVSGCTV